jgi:hypothetical protein
MLFSCSLPTTAQKSADGIFLFKTWLYLEHENNSSRQNIEFPVKDSTVFSLYLNNVTLKLDTLSSTGFSKNYVFLALNFKSQAERAKGNDSSLRYNDKFSFLEYIVIPTLCNKYVLCVNQTTGLSYRLQGFSGNDFFSLLRDTKADYRSDNKKQLKNSIFFKKNQVEGIDFACIFKALRKGSYNAEKYPCLYTCRGSKEIIWIH